MAFCPERVVQGLAIDEIQRMPQIISGTTPAAEQQAAAIFSRIATSVVPLRPIEAEFAKLFCNAYRYIQFAASNQFFMMAQAAGCDYSRIVAGIKQEYPRMSGCPGQDLPQGRACSRTRCSSRRSRITSSGSATRPSMSTKAFPHTWSTTSGAASPWPA